MIYWTQRLCIHDFKHLEGEKEAWKAGEVQPFPNIQMFGITLSLLQCVGVPSATEVESLPRTRLRERFSGNGDTLSCTVSGRNELPLL